MAASTELKNEKKLFFTTTDLLQRLNSSIQDSVGDCDNVSSSGGFELQRQMPDGSYRRAEEGEVAAANFQTKMKQVCFDRTRESLNVATPVFSSFYYKMSSIIDTFCIILHMKGSRNDR